MSVETELIRSFLNRWGDRATGIGDDAAILSVPANEKLVVSTDASVEGVHFRRSDILPAEVGYRAAAAALSDLAAMAARPLGLLFAVVLPSSWRGDVESIADGVGEAARISKCPIIGGNISSGEQLSITTTVLGSSAKPLTRSGARPGNSLYVTGMLGGAGAAVESWLAGLKPAAACRRKFASPTPRIPEALWLGANGVTSCIDISDGLAADAAHIAEASSVALTIEAETLPFDACTSPEHALAGGEDYELLVSAPALNVDEFQRVFGIPLTRIGTVAAGAPGVRILKAGTEIAAPPGFDHLRER